MKKLAFIILGMGLLAGLNSCSEDFKVAAPYKNITFVYGFLNVQDTAHYIRIQKAFLDEQQSAIDMAKVADSSFHASLDVRVKEINLANSVISTTSLNRVDLNFEGYPKDSGGFFNAPSYAYKFKKALNPAYRYRLVITNVATGTTDSSEINIIDPTAFGSDLIKSPLYKLNFWQTVPSGINYQLVVKVAPHVAYIEGIIRFHWIEKNTTAGTSIRRSADFLIESKPVGSATQQLALLTPNIRFYSFLQNVMQPAPMGESRYLDSCDIYIYGAGADYYNYIQSRLLQGGLTAEQSKPIFTNIRGEDVYGLFSTRAVSFRVNVPIDSATVDSLKVNQITSSLNIQGFADE